MNIKNVLILVIRNFLTASCIVCLDGCLWG